MKKSRFTEKQIVSILKSADTGMRISELCRKHAISEATYYKWTSKYGGMEASDQKRIKELEAENARRKRMYAALALENSAIQDLIVNRLRGLTLNPGQSSTPVGPGSWPTFNARSHLYLCKCQIALFPTRAHVHTRTNP